MKEKNKELKAALLAEYHDQDGLSPYEITSIEESEPSAIAYFFAMFIVSVTAPIVQVIEFIRGK